MQSPGSVTACIHDLGRGEQKEAATRVLCDRYLGEIAHYAERRLRTWGADRGVADGEDAALHALQKVFRGIESGQLQLAGRDDLRRLLLWAARCALINNLDAHHAATGGDGPHRREDEVACRDRDRPDVRVEAEDACRSLLDLLDEDLRRVAMLRLIGYTTSEIVRTLGWSQAKVERKLDRIRNKWALFAPHEPSKGGRGEAADAGAPACDVGGTTTILHGLNGRPHPSPAELGSVPPMKPTVGDTPGGHT